jgi:microsomal epoxide hydrolase
MRCRRFTGCGSIARAALVVLALALVPLLVAMPAAARDVASRTFETSDGVRLHYLEAGSGRPLVFVPGWTMPARIWQAQIDHFSATHRVIALDPRSQGESAIARSGHTPERRARDITELLDRVVGEPAVVAGWSLGVLELLAHVDAEGDARLLALVLVDNSVGEEPPPAAGPRSTFFADLRRDRAGTTRKFVQAMYRRPDPVPSVDEITRAALRTPTDAAIALLSYPWPRERWRNALYATRKPVLYVVTPRWRAQGDNVVRRHADATLEVFEGAGHALFVDEAARFNRILDRFLADKVGP